MSLDNESGNLEKIDTIVVVMLENRSFDHMLGYLSLENGRRDINGLQAEFENTYAGRRYPVHHLETTRVSVDPEHFAEAVDKQIGGGRMDGFVASCDAALRSSGIPDGDPGVVMGYYNGADLPVYEHLAEEFLVCDRWFSSVPGATLPNRLYSLSGRAAATRDDLPPHVPPIYHQASLMRHLDAHAVSWRWYSFEPGTLRMADVRYRLGHHDQFAYFSKTGLPWKTVLDITVNSKAGSFLEDAARGTLPSVSWIDPAFTNFNPLGFPVDDDHPPADVKDGQDLVLAIYDALASSPQWERSMLVVIYDEHGGFFDHVAPPDAADDNPKMFGRYGVRVPAIIVSPWVGPRSVSHTLFDHTSIIKTILSRFCPEALDTPRRPDRARGLLNIRPQHLGARAAHANHLGPLLTATQPRTAPPRDALIRDAIARPTTHSPTVNPETDRQAQPARQLTDLQKRILAASKELTRLGHPEGAP
jgi:phospholipase C